MTATTESNDEIDLGFADYEAKPRATAWYVFEDLPGRPAFRTRAMARRLNPELASALQRSPRHQRPKSTKPDEILRNDADDRREYRAHAERHLVVDWRGFENRKTGQEIPYSKEMAPKVIAQIPAGSFDKYLAWCTDEQHFAPAMSAEEVENLAGK